MKKQVLSFNEFIFEAYRIVNEEEGKTTGSLDALKKLLGGGLGFSKSEQSKLDTLIDRLDELNPSAKLEEYATDSADTLSVALNKASEGINIANSGVTSDRSVKDKYGWLVNGTCRVKGSPSYRNDPDVSWSTGNKETSGVGNDTTTESLANVLKIVFEYNLSVAKEMAEGGKKLLKRDSNFGTKGKSKGKALQFVTILEESLKTDIIQVVNYDEDDVPGQSPSGEYGFAFPVYTIYDISDDGNELSMDTYEEVLPPDPTELTVEVTDKPYNSTGIDFFGENEVEMSEDGMAALRSILSEFHSISKVVVNGGASSKPTDRAGGNEKLAKDRMKEGFTVLGQMKKDGVEQLKNAVITEGTATVQAAAPKESDPKNQQVSFIISGTIRKISESTDKTPVVIQKVDIKTAQKVTFRKNYFYCSFNIS
jgi:hypothetical protein